MDHDESAGIPGVAGTGAALTGGLWLGHVAGGRGTWGLPMYRALSAFVVALGLIAGQDPLLQVRQQACWSASRGAIAIVAGLPVGAPPEARLTLRQT